MIPHYTKRGKPKRSVEQLFNNDTGKWEFTHRLVSRWKDDSGSNLDYTGLEELLQVSNTDTVLGKYKKKSPVISSIEYLDEKIDTGCLTIDGKEEFHNYHTFAVEAGIYVKNSMMEDFWLPRRDGSKGTEITTLPAGQSLGQMEDVEYFKNKLMRALNVPITRLIPEQGFSLGRSSEITRDELKFHKFIKRLRAKFSVLFIDVLKVQLIAKGIIKVEEWDEISKQLFIEYRKDNSFSELKDLEILNNRLEALGRIEPYVGKYYSRAFVQKSILRFTEDEIGDLNTEIEQEAPEQPEQEQPDEGQGNE